MMSEARNELSTYSYNTVLTLYQLTSKTEYNIYILFLVALHDTGLTYDTTQQVRVLLQSLAVEHMQFTINVQILKFLNTNFSLYSSINESHSGNTKTAREEQMEKWDNCSRQPSRLQNLDAHAYIFFSVRGRRKQANSASFTI